MFSFSIKLLHPSALTSTSSVCVRVCVSVCVCVCVVTLLSQSENGDIGCYGESIAEQSGKWLSAVGSALPVNVLVKVVSVELSGWEGRKLKLKY